METKTLQFKLDDLSDEGVITGYGSVFDLEDSYRDIVAPGAFKDSLREHEERGTRPSLLWQHKPSEPIGRWDEIVEDEKGLRVTGKLTMSVTKAREAFDLLKDQALDGLSIGFWSRDYSLDEVDGVRTIKKAELVEISLVTFPANSAARIDSVKAAMLSERELERRLTRDARLSRRVAQALMRGGFSELTATREAGGSNVSESELREQLRSMFNGS